jgi:hypothetical protein
LASDRAVLVTVWLLANESSKPTCQGLAVGWSALACPVYSPSLLSRDQIFGPLLSTL